MNRCFQMWERLLRAPWTAWRSNQSILKEINPEYSLERLMMKLKLQYLATWWEELTPYKRPWCWERLRTGGKMGDSGWDGWMAPSTQWTWVGANSRRLWRTGIPGMLQSLVSQRVRHGWVTEQQKQFGIKEMVPHIPMPANLLTDSFLIF